jgi:predicted amidohydrolase
VTALLTIAIAQFAPVADTAANLAAVADAAADAVGRGAALLVAPEYSSFSTADFGRAHLDAAESLDGPWITGLGAIAQENGITIVAGMSEQGDAVDRFRNTVVTVAPDGTVAGAYRKVHLYDAFGARESDWIEPGDVDQVPLVTVDGVRIGVQTCYDLRFPEVTRRLAAAGADVVLVPAQWVPGPNKEHHWHTLLSARAIENTVFVVGACQTPPLGVGHSVVLDPSGVVLAGLGAAPGVLTAAVAPAAVAQVRTVNPSLALRRYDVVPR